MNVDLEQCALVEPQSDADWSAYHDTILADVAKTEF